MSNGMPSTSHLWSIFGALVATVVGAAAANLPVTEQSEGEVFVSIGTGQLSGVYYPVAKAICQIVNQDIRAHRVRCSPEATPGSVYNIGALQSGELEFAIVQSDIQFTAYHGGDPWTAKGFDGLRSVFSLYPEQVTVMSRADARIKGLGDLAGRRVNVGGQGSGTRATWDAIEAELGWNSAQRVRPAELSADASVSALCSGAIDASLMIIGHPSSLAISQLNACPAIFIPMTGPAIDRLIHDHHYYQHGAIPAEAYGMGSDVPTFGGRATLVTSAAVDARVVAVVAKAVLTHVAELRQLHPVLTTLKARDMIEVGLTAPLHPGAVEAYKTLDLSE